MVLTLQIDHEIIEELKPVESSYGDKNEPIHLGAAMFIIAK